MITMPTSTTAEPGRETASGQPAPVGERGLYVYGIVVSKSNRPLGPIGLDQQEVYVATEGSEGGKGSKGSLSAVVHDCTATPYQSADRPTLETWIMAHQQVVMEAGRRFGAILPMTFNMIVHGPDDTAADRLRAWLAQRHDQFTDLLARLDGKAEYGVQILWDRDAAAEAIVQTDPALQALRRQIEGKPKGLGYMLRQKLAKATRAAIETWAQRTAGNFYERIRSCVDDVRVNKAGKGKEQRQMLLTLSCLMPGDTTALGETLDEIARTPGIAVRFTGPWPPYSFVSPG